MTKCEQHNTVGCLICKVVSVADDTLDNMVQQASTPSLATLFKKAKDAGAIKPVSAYGNQIPSMPV